MNQSPQQYSEPFPAPPLHAPYAAPPPRAQTAPGFGDKAGEHLRMQRGSYGAWAWVVLGFLLQIGVLGSIVLLVALFGASGLKHLSEPVGGWFFLVVACASPVVGVAGAYYTFRDRWRCIEAFSSRWCSGLANFSMIYVPWVALVYANVRAVQKFSGR